jgi:hypothetical protein
MMKSKTIIAIGLALALVASSASLVQAGGGGWGIPINVFALDCYTINGVNPPHEVSLDDQFFSGSDNDASTTPRGAPPAPPVPLGKAKLLCTPAVVGVIAPENPQLQLGGMTTDQVVCYATPANPSPTVSKKISDPFGNQVVVVGAPAFTCVGAFTCNDVTSNNTCFSSD